MRALMRALLLTACCSALQTLSLQSLSPAVQRSIAQRQTLDTLQNAVSGAALWRQCFLEGRVPDETLDELSWPNEPTRAACLVAFGPVARLVGRNPRLADLALLALIDAATTTTDEEHVEPPLAPTVAAVSKAFFMWVGWMWSATVDSAAELADLHLAGEHAEALWGLACM